MQPRIALSKVGQYGLRQLDEYGYFCGIPPLTGVIETVTINDAFSLRYTLSDDVFQGESVCEGRNVLAWLCAANDETPVAVLEAVVLSRGQELGLAVPEACDQISEGLYNITAHLAKTCTIALADFLEQAGVIVVTRLEVRRDSRHHSRSLQFVDALCCRVNQKYPLALLVVQPFPLQYEHCEPDADSDNYDPFWSAFRDDVDKLSNFYSYVFNCSSVSQDSSLLFKALPGWLLRNDRYGWSISSSE